MKKQYLDYAGLKRVLKRLLPGARKIWHGTEAEWEALSETERDKYDQAEVIDLRTWHTGPDWANAVAITAAQLTAGYTVPDDGMLVGYFTPSSGSMLLKINDIAISRSDYAVNSWVSVGNVQSPVNKDDIIKATASMSNLDIHFVPWKSR